MHTIFEREFLKHAAPAISKLTRQAAESAGKAIYDTTKATADKVPAWKKKLQDTYLKSKPKDVYV